MKPACIIVTMGDRSTQLARAIESVRAQTTPTELVIVVNDAHIDDVPGAQMLRLPANLGPGGGRNKGVEATDADVLFFLDDDAAFGQDDLVERALARFEGRRDLGIITFRIDDPDGRPPQRRHVPRLRAGDPTRSSDVTVFLEGACAIRRAVYDRTGGYPEELFFDHQGTDLAWAALDLGARIHYAGDLVVHHPAEPPTRHPTFHYMTARNRVFVVRRRLPATLAILHVLTWVVLSLTRASSMAARRELLKGFRDGMRLPCGERKPIKWRTAWRMTMLGRPPIV